MSMLPALTPRRILILCIALVVLQGLNLLMMDHVLICKCGFVKLWEGNPNSSNNSQHISDWYSFSHIIHGFIFFFILWLIPTTRKLSFATRLLIAIFAESAWEVLENTPFIINRYRAATISLGYN